MTNLFADQSGVFYGEEGYLKLLKFVKNNGENRPDRTGTGVISYFSPPNMEFDLSHGFPLLTTKKTFYRGVVEELLFFLRGDCQTKKLEAKGINIWKGNTTREFLDSRGLHSLSEGHMGKGYGYQWRNFGESYTRSDCCSTDTPRLEREIVHYTDNDGTVKGFVVNSTVIEEKRSTDQIKTILKSLKEDKYSRRHIVSAWNPKQLDDMALPPCHIMFQMFVSNNDTLHCKMYMRSVDLFLGAPFNIASYAALTYIFAECLGYKPGRLIVDMGDAHIYNTHMDAVDEQLSREPYPFPTLKITKELTKLDDILALEFTDFEMMGYKSHPPIKADMAV